MSKLNDLTGKEWVKQTKSWFVLSGRSRGKNVVNHPGKFPEELAERYISFFSKPEEVIFDPFMGVGSTAVAANQLGREVKGIEVNKEYFQVINDRAKGSFILGDSRNQEIYPQIGMVDFILTSPPYWNMLKKKRGNSKSQHSLREEKQLSLFYSENDPTDLGNLNDYQLFLNELKKVFKNSYEILKDKSYMVVVVQNFRDKDLGYTTFAWDVVPLMQEIGFSFEGEQLWLQDDKQLGIWGYPSTFISNIHHHYCLVFRKKHA